MTPDAMRQMIVSTAKFIVGLSANPRDAISRAKYLELVGPEETQDMRNQMGSMSGCGLTVAGIWRMAGVKSRLLDAPYRVGTAVSRLISLAREAKAWVPYTDDSKPGIGDMVLIGDNGPGGPEHVYTILSFKNTEEEGVLILRTVDGGQQDYNKYQLILEKNHVWKNGKDHSFFNQEIKTNLAGGRKIYGWINCTKLSRE